MKKKTNKSVNNAASLSNGIVIISNKNPLYAVFTYYDESKTIKDRYIVGSQIKHLLEIQDNPIIVDKRLKTNIAIILIILAYVAYVLTYNIGFAIGAICFVYKEGLKYVITFCIMVKQYKSKNGSNYQLAKFHSAEHKAIGAYEKLGRIPTYEEVKKASRFAKHCGSMLIINELFYQISYPILIIISGELVPFIESIMPNMGIGKKFLVFVILAIAIVILYIVILKIVKKYSILRFMQIFFTNKPTEKEIQLSIKALKNFEELERNVS